MQTADQGAGPGARSQWWWWAQAGCSGPLAARGRGGSGARRLIVQGPGRAHGRSGRGAVPTAFRQSHLA